MSLEQRLSRHREALERYLQQAVDSPNPQLRQSLQQVLASGGKRLRPLLIFLSARLCDPALDDGSLLPLEAAAELVHTASLIHDDMIDDSPLRRGQPSLHLLVGRQKALQYGDYLLFKALTLAEGEPANIFFVETARDMCLGEFLQMESRFSFAAQSRADYFLRIQGKTAGFFAACCALGARAGQGDEQQNEALKEYGRQLGLAFQIADDILDYQNSPVFGKPQGQDLRQGIFTLPLLYVLEQPDTADLRQLAEKRDKTEAEVAALIAAVEARGGLAYGGEVLRNYGQQASQALDIFADSEEKAFLQELALKLTKRNY